MITIGHLFGPSRPRCRWGVAWSRRCTPPCCSPRPARAGSSAARPRSSLQRSGHVTTLPTYTPTQATCSEGGGLPVLLGDPVLAGVMLPGHDLLHLLGVEPLHRTRAHRPAEYSCTQQIQQNNNEADSRFPANLMIAATVGDGCCWATTMSGMTSAALIRLVCKTRDHK